MKLSANIILWFLALSVTASSCAGPVPDRILLHDDFENTEYCFITSSEAESEFSIVLARLEKLFDFRSNQGTWVRSYIKGNGSESSFLLIQGTCNKIMPEIKKDFSESITDLRAIQLNKNTYSQFQIVTPESLLKAPLESCMMQLKIPNIEVNSERNFFQEIKFQLVVAGVPIALIVPHSEDGAFLFLFKACDRRDEFIQTLADLMRSNQFDIATSAFAISVDANEFQYKAYESKHWLAEPVY